VNIDRVLREREVKAITGLDRVTRWRLEREDAFPKRFKIGKNAVGWRASEIADWLDQRSQQRVA
jgi:prophage regulatory protein